MEKAICFKEALARTYEKNMSALQGTTGKRVLGKNQ
jgi:hypothetical protein